MSIVCVTVLILIKINLNQNSYANHMKYMTNASIVIILEHSNTISGNKKGIQIWWLSQQLKLELS